MFGKNSKLCFTISLAILLATILIVLLGFPKIVQKQIQKQVQIDNSSMMFEKWKKLPIPLIFKVYVFNVTNRDDINNGEKPRLQEVGPFVYKQYREKNILGYGPNDTVKYMLKRTFVFDSEASGGLNEDDELTVINFSYMAAILQIHDIAPGFVTMVNPALEIFFTKLEDPFMTVKMKDLFFDGIFLNCNANSSALVLVCGKIKADMPQTMRPAPDGTGFYFSMFGHMNNSEAGPYEMIRGTQNLYDLGKIVSYDGRTSYQDKWDDQYCGMLNGTDSSIFPPIDESNVPPKLYTVEPDLCRSMSVDLVEKTTVSNMSAYLYEASEMVLASKSANKDNKCYCKRNWSASHDGCLLMGVLNLMPCQGAPAIATFPHFYMASEELLEYIEEGVQPDKEKHGSYAYLDPSTGVVLKGAKRLQFNIELRRMPKVPQLESVPTGLFPLLWMEEGAELSGPLLEEVRDGHKLLHYAEVGRWALLALVAAACLLCALVAMKTHLPFCRRHTDSVSFIHNGATNPNTKGF